jgi:signal transduction histidine kinase
VPCFPLVAGVGASEVQPVSKTKPRGEPVQTMPLDNSRVSEDAVRIAPGRTFGVGGVAAGGDPEEPGADRPTAEPPWLVVASPGKQEPDGRRRSARVYLQVIAMTVVVVFGVTFFAASASRGVAEDQAIEAAAQRANLLAEVVVQPALGDGVLIQDPAAITRLATAVQEHVVGMHITRIKFWTADGLIVYSNDPRLVGRTFPLSEDHKEVLAESTLRAEVTNLDEPENELERGEGKLLEVYRPVRTPGGAALVMETYSPYSTVDKATSQLWRRFAPITLASLFALMLLLLPVLWHLLRRLHVGQAQREALLERAVQASADERRRIAATLHDGVVQDLVGASWAVSGAAGQVEAHGLPEVAAGVGAAAQTVRASIGGLRSLLADIYPPSLNAIGLEAALRDLVATLRSRDVDVSLDCRYSRGDLLTKDRERLLFRIAQECLNNAVRHSAATTITITLAEDDGVLVSRRGGRRPRFRRRNAGHRAEGATLRTSADGGRGQAGRRRAVAGLRPRRRHPLAVTHTRRQETSGGSASLLAVDAARCRLTRARAIASDQRPLQQTGVFLLISRAVPLHHGRGGRRRSGPDPRQVLDRAFTQPADQGPRWRRRHRGRIWV